MKFPADSILIIRMSGIGDVLWTTPMLRSLRSAYPRARIAYVARPASAQVLEHNPHIDEVLLFEQKSLFWQAGFLARLRREGFDMSIDLVCTPATALQSLMSRARTRIGFDFRIRKMCYNHRLSARAANYGHEVEFNLFVLNYMGVPVRSKELDWFVATEEQEWAHECWRSLALPEGEPVVGLIPTGAYESKKWPLNYWRELTRCCSDIRFIVFWGNDVEHRDAQHLVAHGNGRVVAAPESTLRQAAALMHYCALVIGNDSGPLHVATALRKPVIALYGPSNPASQGPWCETATVVQADDVDSICCRRVDCPDPVYMKGIVPERIVELTLRRIYGLDSATGQSA